MPKKQKTIEEELLDKKPTLEQQLEIFIKWLESNSLTTEAIKKANDWLDNFPGVVPEKVRDKVEKLLGRQSSFSPLVPSKGWLSKYYEYTKFAEGPPVFQFFCGATILGAVTKRNIYYQRGHDRIYPNLGAILIAPTGVCRKTKGATEIAVNILRKSELAEILPERMTPEFFINTLSNMDSSKAIFAYAPELKFMFGENKYLKDMLPTVTRLMDRPEVLPVGTIVRGLEELCCVGLSFLGGSAPDLISEILPRSAFGGGWMSRFLFIVQWTTPRRFARPPLPSKELEQELIQGLQAVAELEQEVLFEKKAGEWYDQWYETPLETNGDMEDYLAGYYARKHTFLIELAMIIMVSKLKTQLELPELKEALKILEWVEAYLPSMFRQIGMSERAKNYQKVVKFIIGKKSISHRELLSRYSYCMNAKEMRDIVSMAIEAGIIKQFTFDRATYYGVI